MRKFFCILFLSSVIHFRVMAQQPTITTSLAVNAVNNVLLGGSIVTSNIVFNGVPQQLGYFTHGSSFGIDTGIVISTGNVGDIPGSVLTTASTNVLSTNLDADILSSLQQNSALSTSANDIASLEFDFVPRGDTVVFDYVFGSEEYPEFVCNFNDGFAMFLSGPGITGTFSNGAVNLAKVPGTNTPVSISTVNVSNESCAQANSNSNYYVNNLALNGNSIAYDGYTKVFKARHQVQCGQTYHLKIIIADCNDRIYDSGVFLKARSLTTSSSDYKMAVNVIPSSTLFYEGCGTAQFTITRPPPYTQPLTLPITVSGTATAGTDYAASPTTVTFAAGQQNAFVQFSGIVDNFNESPETIVLSVASLICPNVAISKSVYLYDYNHLNITTGPDSVNICIGKPVSYHEMLMSGNVQSFNWSNGSTNPSLSFVANASNSNMWYYVQAISNCGVDTIVDSVYVHSLDTNGAKISISHSLQYELCPELDTLVITLSVGVASPITYPITVSGSASNNLDYSFIDTLVHFVPGVLTYYVPFNLLPDGLNNESIEDLVIKIEPHPNSCVCSQTTTLDVKIIDSSDVKIEIADVALTCPGQLITLSPIHKSPNGVVYWNTFNSHTTNYSFTSNTTDTLQVVVSIIDTVCGLPKIDIDTAYIFPPIYNTLNIVAPTSMVLPCLNNNLIFNSVLNGGIPNYHYWWYNANNVLLDTNNSMTQNVTQNSNFKLIVKDGCNKKDTLIFSVTETPRPEFTLTAADIVTAQCPNQIVNINTTTIGGIQPYQYIWSNGATTPNYQTTINDTTTLLLTAKDSCANERRKIIKLIPANYKPLTLNLIADTAVCPGQIALISAQANNGLTQYVYSFSTTSSANSLSNFDINSVEASLTNSSFFKATCVDACQNTISDSIYIHRYADCNAHIRNVVVLDGINGNKAFFIDHVEEYPNTHVIIYNRWGIKVYENFNFTNNASWDAENADAGTFYYIAEFDNQLMYENNKRTGFIQVVK